jgi:alpha-tubulin suppressor-like RCC1 family protein
MPVIYLRVLLIAFAFFTCLQASSAVKDFTLGQFHTCATNEDDQLYCWGDNTYGQLGLEHEALQAKPRRIPLGDKVIAVSAGFYHTCALTANHQVFCFGDNRKKQLGLEHLDREHQPRIYKSSQPVKVNLPTGRQFKTLISGPYSNCAIDMNSSAYCWGHIKYKKTFRLWISAIAQPEKLPLADIQHLALGHQQICATSENNLYCWGQVSSFSCNGDSISTHPNMPIYKGHAISNLSFGEDHLCLTDDHQGLCLGDNYYQQITSTTKSSRITCPRSAASREFGDILTTNAGLGSTCIVTSQGRLYCKGFNRFEQLGLANPAFWATPEKNITMRQFSFKDFAANTRINDENQFKDVKVAQWHTCALDRQDHIWCFGANHFGQLGQNKVSPSAKPKRISL